MNYAYVASRFEISLRGEILSWSHHKQVAGLRPLLADGLLASAKRAGWSRNRLRREVRQQRELRSGSRLSDR
jgi:hypothetical protein